MFPIFWSVCGCLLVRRLGRNGTREIADFAAPALSRAQTENNDDANANKEKYNQNRSKFDFPNTLTPLAGPNLARAFRHTPPPTLTQH